jgi:hypothetical protein
VTALGQAGVSAALAGEIAQPFFAGKGSLVAINQAPPAVQVFEFAGRAMTAAAAAMISPDGRFIGNTHPDWVATPHFYKTTEVIVLYVGDDLTVLRGLESVVGRQFAGG